MNAFPLVFAALLGWGSAHAGTVYTQTFESGSAGPNWSGIKSIKSTEGLSAFGFGSLHLKNNGQSASVLTLSRLKPHSEMTVSFSLAMWDSIDSDSDLFQVQVDGGFVINREFGNYWGESTGPGTALTPPFTGNYTPNLGYQGWRDSARAVSVTFAHSAPSATISFQFPNSQGGADESFGIDNVVVTTRPVPEPATFALMGLGLMGLALVRFNRLATRFAAPR